MLYHLLGLPSGRFQRRFPAKLHDAFLVFRDVAVCRAHRNLVRVASQTVRGGLFRQ